MQGAVVTFVPGVFSFARVWRRQVGTGWQRRAVEIAPRAGYLLHGSVRTEWEHSISPMDRLRYSVTFRSFRPDIHPPA